MFDNLSCKDSIGVRWIDTRCSSPLLLLHHLLLVALGLLPACPPSFGAPKSQNRLSTLLLHLICVRPRLGEIRPRYGEHRSCERIKSHCTLDIWVVHTMPVFLQPVAYPSNPGGCGEGRMEGGGWAEATTKWSTTGRGLQAFIHRAFFLCRTPEREREEDC